MKSEIVWHRVAKKPELNTKLFIIYDKRIYTGFTQETNGEFVWLEDSRIERLRETFITAWAYQPKIENIRR